MFFVQVTNLKPNTPKKPSRYLLNDFEFLVCPLFLRIDNFCLEVLDQENFNRPAVSLEFNKTKYCKLNK